MKLKSRLTRTLILAAAAGLLLSSCSSGSNSVPQDSTLSQSIAGTWGDKTENTQPSIEFKPDKNEDMGRFSGSDGCNRVSGNYQIDGEVIELGAIATTLMACEGVDAWLSSSTTAKLNGETIEFFAEDGAKLGSLKRESSL